jgi:hypothetical protein
MVVARTIERTASILALEEGHPADAPIFASRLESQMPLAQERITEFVNAFDELGGDHALGGLAVELPRKQLAALAQARESSQLGTLIRQAESMATCLDRLVALLVQERTAVVAHRDQLAAQQRALLEQR